MAKKIIYTLEINGTETQMQNLNKIEKELVDVRVEIDKLNKKQKDGIALDQQEQAELNKLIVREKDLVNQRTQQNRAIQQTINYQNAEVNTLRKVNAELAIQKQKIQDAVIGSKEYYQIAQRIKQLEKQQRDFNAEVGRGTTFVGEYSRGFRNAFAKVGTAVAGVMAVVAGFNRLLGSSINTFKDFEKGQALLRGAMDATNATIEEDSIRLAKEYGIELTTLNKALYEAAQAGVKSADLIAYLGESAKLAIAGQAELNTVVDGTTSIMNAYGLQIEDLNKITNALFTAQLYGKITIQEFAESIGTVIPMARQAGMSFQELFSAVAELTRVGVPVDVAMTAMRAGISSILQPSEEAKKAFQELGIETGAVAIQQQGFMNIIAKITNATKENKDMLTSLIPEMRGFTAVASFTEENLAMYDKILNDVTNSIGENSIMMVAYREQMATLAKETDRHKATMAGLRVEIGEKLRPTYNKFLQTGANLLEWFSKHINFVVSLVSSLAKLVGIYTAWRLATALMNDQNKINLFLTQALTGAKKAYASVIGTLTIATEANTTATKVATTATEAQTVAQKGLNTATKAFPYNWIAAALTGVIMLLGSIWNKAKAAREEQERYNRSLDEAKQSVTGMAVELEYLLKVAKDETKSLQERGDAIKRINEISPEHLGNINAETIATEQAAISLKAYVALMQEKAIKQAKINELTNIAIELDRINSGELQALTGWQKFININDYTKFNFQVRNTIKYQDELLQRQEEINKSLGINTEETKKSTDATTNAAQAADQKAAADKAANDELNRLIEGNKTQAQLVQDRINAENNLYETNKKRYSELQTDQKTINSLLDQEKIRHDNMIASIREEGMEKNKNYSKEVDWLGKLQGLQVEGIVNDSAKAIVQEQERYEKQLKIYNDEVGDIKVRNQLIEAETGAHYAKMQDIIGRFKLDNSLQLQIEQERILYEQGVNDFRTYVNNVTDIVEDAQLMKTVEEIYDLELGKINDFVTQAIDAENKRWEEQSISLEQGSARYLAAMEQHIANLEELQQAAEAAKALQVPFELAEEVNVEDSPEIIALQQTLDFKLQMIREAAKTNVEYAQQLSDDLIKIDEERYQKQSTIYEASSDLAIASLGVVLQFAKKGSALEKALIVTMKAIEVAKVIIKMAASNAAITFAATAQVAAMPLAAPGIIANMVAMKTLNKINAAAAIATIVGQTVAEFKAAKGYIVKGKGTATSDNIHAMVSPGEAIINAKSMQDSDVLTLTGTPKQIASEINSYKGYGIKFAEGKAPVYSPSVKTVTEQIPKDLIRGIVQETVAGIVNIPVVVSEKEITQKQRMVQMVEKEGDF